MFSYLAPLAGRGRRAFARRVRGSLRTLLCLPYSLIEAPHPNPLPAKSGERERERERERN